MAWQGDEGKVQQLCQMFSAASSPNTQVQQEVLKSLQQFSQMPDFNMYLIKVFFQMTNAPVDVRQRSGLLLKTNVLSMQRGSIAPALVENINSQLLAAMRDGSKAIRHTSGTILTSMVRKVGFNACSQVLESLVDSLGNQSAEVLEGSVSAIGKICEDGVSFLGHVERPGGVEPSIMQEAQLFVTWANQRALPRLLDCASPAAPDMVKQSALESLNFFVLGGVLVNEKYGMQQYAPRVIEAFGVLANDSNPDVLQQVCKGFACIIEDSWSCLTDQHYQIVLQFMLKASQSQDYGVRQEALAVWIACAGQPDSWGIVQGMLKELVPTLITNMIYTDADYMILEPSQVENDNASVPDSLDSIKPRFHVESNNVDGDEDDTGKTDRSSHGWGAEWTARKAAAKSLDHLSSVFSEIMELVLPQIEQKLNHASWEHQEAGVLALGAIGVHCREKLAQFLPAVLGLLVRLCEAQQPLLRGISCWCLSRFAKWIFHESSDRQQVIVSVLKVILQRCLDRNKRVQETAISALATLIGVGGNLINPFLNEIVETLVKAFQLYQLKNQCILYDAVGALTWAAGTELNKPDYMKSLIVPVLEKFATVSNYDVLALPICECVAATFQSLGQQLVSAIPRVSMCCLKSINDSAMAAQMWEQNPNEYERPPIEIMSSCCDILSAIIEGLREQSPAVVAPLGVFSVIPLCAQSSSSRVKQSGFWLISVATWHCFDQLVPLLSQIVPACVSGLGPTTTPTVGVNAARAVGELCQRGPPDMLTPHLQSLLPAILAILQRQNLAQWQMQGHFQLLGAVCETLNRLRQKTALGQQWAPFCSQLPAAELQKLQQRFHLSV